MGVICNSCYRDNNTHRIIQQKNKEINTDDNCYQCKAEIIKRPDIGYEDFVIKINAQHIGNHSCDEQILFIIFNYPVNFVNCSNGNLISSNNTTRIKVKLVYHNNPNDNIEISDFHIKCAQNDLEIVNCTINDNH